MDLLCTLTQDRLQHGIRLRALQGRCDVQYLLIGHIRLFAGEVFQSVTALKSVQTSESNLKELFLAENLLEVQALQV